MFDVGKIDVVIFDCYVCDVMINICVISRLIFFSTSKSFIVLILCILSNLFDPGRSYCYWDSIKPCKSNEFRLVAYGSVTRG